MSVAGVVPLSGRLPVARRCRSDRCNQPVAFAYTERGVTQVVDPDPVEAGNLVLWRDEAGTRRLRVRTLGRVLFDPFADLPGDRYQDHHVTCAEPEAFGPRS